MAVRMMTSKEKANQPNVETVMNYPGHEVTRIYHHWECPHCNESVFINEKGPNCTDRCTNYDPLYMETTYQGCVLETYERNGYDDSDFYAIVWDEESQSIKHIEYATTRGWSYPNGASVDATPEVRAKAENYIKQRELIRWREDNQKQAQMPYKGRTVRVKSGRKVKAGVIAEVFWFGDDQFKQASYNRYNRHNPYVGLVNRFNTSRKRVGIRWTEDGKQHKEFLAADNVEVIDPENYLETEPTLESFHVQYRLC